MIALLLAGIPFIVHAAVTVPRFLTMVGEIAKAEGQTARLAEPSVDDGGFNPYTLDLWDRLSSGEPIRSVNVELAARAARLGWHLKVQQRFAYCWIGAIIVAGMLRL